MSDIYERARDALLRTRERPESAMLAMALYEALGDPNADPMLLEALVEEAERVVSVSRPDDS